eukprot:3342776-Rhodomonas_salina.3
MSEAENAHFIVGKLRAPCTSLARTPRSQRSLKMSADASRRTLKHRSTSTVSRPFQNASEPKQNNEGSTLAVLTAATHPVSSRAHRSPAAPACATTTKPHENAQTA